MTRHQKPAYSKIKSAITSTIDRRRNRVKCRCRPTVLKPYFQRPISPRTIEIDVAMNSGYDTFVIDIPPEFEADVLAGRQPSVQTGLSA